MADSIRVLAVEYNRVLLDGICVLLGMQPDLAVVGTASTAESAISLFANLRPDLSIIDLDLPLRSGFYAVERIRQMDPEAWIIGQITNEWPEAASRLSLGGSSVILAKDRIGTMLVPLIRAGHSAADGKF